MECGVVLRGVGQGCAQQGYLSCNLDKGNCGTVVNYALHELAFSSTACICG